MGGTAIPPVKPPVGTGPKGKPVGAGPKGKPVGSGTSGKGKGGGGKAKAGDLVPVWMDVETAKFLVRTLTSALEGNTQPKKKTGKK